MTIKTSRPSTSRSVGLPEIPEEEAATAVNAPQERPVTASNLTEYNQSFRRRPGATRPRNPTGGWQARNISNILPSGPEIPLQPSRAGRRPPPEIWLARQATSQIFPAVPRQVPPPPTTGDARDVNNNIPGTGLAPAPPLVAGSRRRTGRWPWQTRAQTSSIFLGDYVENAPPRSSPPPQASRPGPSSIHTKWPWQERAQKSVIFELLSGQDTGQNKPRHRIYEWDQRQSKLVTAAVHQIKPSPEKENTNKPLRTQQQDPKSTGETSSSSSWPWKERAMQSVVFRSPTKPTCPRPVNFLWDQRNSRISVHDDPTVQFPKGSSYSDNYVKWQRLQGGGLKAAGRPCYKDDIAPKKHVENFEKKSEEDNNLGLIRGERRHFKGKAHNSGNGDIISHPVAVTSPTKSVVKVNPSASNVKGETCMDLVPIGYRFSDHRPKL